VRGRRLYRFGYVGASTTYGVFLNDVDSLVRGVLERVFYRRDGTRPPGAQPGAFQLLREFGASIQARTAETAKWSDQQFVESYSGRKRTIYENAVGSLKERPLTTKDSSIRVFTKGEKTDFSGDADPVPRIISPRDPRYNVEVGKYLKPYEHNLYQGIARTFGEPTVLKGMTLERIARTIKKKWDRFADPVAIGADASRFDQHVLRDALEFEHSVYNAHFRSPYLRWLLRMQLNTRATGVCDNGFVRYATEGSRCSGDMNTSMGNCLIMCGIMYAFFRFLGIRASLCNNGDDCVIICERSVEHLVNQHLEEFCLRFGFTVKVEPSVDVIERLVFCQMSPVDTGRGWLMVRNPIKVLTKDGYSLFDLDNEKVFRRYLLSLGKCGVSITGGVPVLQDYYQAMIDQGHGPLIAHEAFHATSTFLLSKGEHRYYTKPTDTARASFYRAFGMSVEQQLEVEKEVRQYEYQWVPTTLGHVGEKPPATWGKLHHLLTECSLSAD